MTPRLVIAVRARRRRDPRSALLVLALAAVSPATGQQPDPLAAARSLEQALVDAIEKAEGAVVSISRVDPSHPELSTNVLDPFGAARDRERRDPEGTLRTSMA